MKLSSILALVPTVTCFASSSLGFVGDYPTCEICGCSFCTDGAFPVLNPTGSIELTEEFFDEFGPGEVSDTFREDFVEDFGFTEIPCSLLELAASGGALSPDICVDELRLNSILRSTCGCPALPSRPFSLWSIIQSVFQFLRRVLGISSS